MMSAIEMCAKTNLNGLSRIIRSRRIADNAIFLNSYLLKSFELIFVYVWVVWFMWI